MDYPQLWVLEWNEVQQAFHVGTLEQSLVKNMMHFLVHRESGWSLVGVFESHADAHRFCDSLKQSKQIVLKHEIQTPLN